MSSERRLALARRQRELVVKSALLREQLRSDAQVLQRPLALADRAWDGWRWVRAHPTGPLTALAVAGVSLLLLRPRRALRWARWGWWCWLGLRRLRGAVPPPG
jgi:hypothetical protein